MALISELMAKLGFDTSSVPADLNKAKQAFDKFGNETTEAAQGHGDKAGDAFSHALEHKLLGMRHASTALATALGLSFEKIADFIAAAVVSGSKEAWTEAVQIADENTKLIQRMIEARMTPKQVEAKRTSDLERAKAEAKGAGNDYSWLDAAADLGGNVFSRTVLERAGLIKDLATRAIESGKANLKVTEAQVKIDEEDRKVREAAKALDDERNASAYEGLQYTERVKALNESIDKIVKEIFSGQLSQLEVIKKRTDLLHLEQKLRAETLQQQGRQEEKEREFSRLTIQRAEMVRKLALDEQNLKNAVGDRSKLTVAEIAQLKPGQKPGSGRSSLDVDTYGLSDQAAAAKRLAAEIEDLQAQAEHLRVSGNTDEASRMFEQIDAKRQTLVDSGFAKSTEGDQFKALRESIHADQEKVNSNLRDIKEVLKGKFVSQ